MKRQPRVVRCKFERMIEIDRSGRERKLVALLLNDISTELDTDEITRVRQEVSEMPDEGLHRTLALRVGLDENADSGELDDALAFVEEPEIISRDVGNLGSAPDLSHADDADSPTTNP